jgi:hypothetical protein
MPPHTHDHSHHHHGHDHAHPHAPGERHPHAKVSLSLLRFSALERFLIAGLLTLVMWAAVIWAIGGKA